MYKAYPRESFIFTSNFIRIVLPISLEALRLDTSSEKTREKTREKIIELIADNKYITITDIATEIGITQKGVEWQIIKLKKENIIQRVGPDKGGHWKVVTTG